VEIESQKKWDSLLLALKERFKMDMDLKSILFIIGLQELGMNQQKFSKDQKLEVMHVAICTLLEPFGHYKYLGRDKDGWPHWELMEKLPALAKDQQEELIKQSILEYWSE
tara:strand:- start:777 stop:1106 length:330 start_codon:yes stop_codon:yes gene_type:complete